MSKATVYLDDDVHRALRMKSAETNESMSQMINDAVRVVMAEDLEDISDWNERRNEQPIGYEEFLRQLRVDGTI
jgi:predicted transcriptional regulator